MKFSIITPTFKQQDLLSKAVTSLQTQTHKDWEMIIVNDSPKDIPYWEFATSINDPRIHYFVNESNRGSNYSKNFALDRLSADSRWVIFLNDDDYFSPDTLETFSQHIMLHGDTKWFVSNRALKNGISLTTFPHNEAFYSYAWSHLLLKRGRGDATHCIETKLITHIHARFSKYVKQGEEWFFLYHVGLHSKLFYFDHNSTISNGIETVSALTPRTKTRDERFESTTQLLYEGGDRGLFKHPTFLLVILIHYLELLIPKK